MVYIEKQKYSTALNVLQISYAHLTYSINIKNAKQTVQ